MTATTPHQDVPEVAGQLRPRRAPGQASDPESGSGAGPRQKPPSLGALGLLRWAWRQLTSMRVALVLLFLLAVAAVPGSVFPQRSANPPAVADWIARNPTLAPWAERLDLFEVYTSPWFSAVYLLLMVSLVGCILPRLGVHLRAIRSEPPRPPKYLRRLPAHDGRDVSLPPEEALSRAAASLRRRRYRVAEHPQELALSAERGYLRETGNLVFHVAVVVILLAVAVGALYGYRGSVLVVEGKGFASSPIQYDSLSMGPRVGPSDLPPFALTLDRFALDFVDDGPMAGAAADFEADVTLVPSPGEEPQARQIRVNEPLAVDGALIHLLNPGYAPEVTVRGPDGSVVFSDAVPFLPQDETFTSTGVVKAQVDPAVGEDIGLQGIFLPTATIGPDGPASVFPEPRNPGLVLTAWVGDLGLDDGVTQSVYRLDTDEMTQLETAPGEPFRSALAVGESVDLPDGQGSVTFDGYRTWANLQVGRNAGKEVALLGTILLVGGLLPTLFVRRRRVFVRAESANAEVDPSPGLDAGADLDSRRDLDSSGDLDSGRDLDSSVSKSPATVLVVGGLDRSGGGGMDDEIREILDDVADQRDPAERGTQ